MSSYVSRSMLLLTLVVVGLASRGAAQEKSRDELVRDDRAKVDALDRWIYNDVAAGFEAAQKTGKPVLVIFRCVPCHACAQLDQSVVEAAPELQELLDKFVCVRVVHANGMDLGLFQFDYDQSFAAFIMNGDKTIYGRYGTRSHQTQSDEDVSLAGFVAALKAGLEIHANYPDSRVELVGKQPHDRPQFATPEQSPRLAKKYGTKLDYEGKVAASCIHCHQVGEALQSAFRDEGKPLPTKLLFPYPHPKVLGLIMDPNSCAKIARVEAESAAAGDGFLVDDEIVTLGGQPIISMADLQWVLHHAGDNRSTPATVRREGQIVPLKLTLAPGWRERGDLSWRAMSWPLRRMTTGGMRLEELSPAARAERKLPDDSLALIATHVGEYGEHAHAKRQGFKKGDVITSIAGVSKPMRETDLIAMLANRPAGDEIPVEVLRGSQRIQLSLMMQK